MCAKASSHDEILNAAEALVLEEGAGRMTLEAVAERAGVSKGGLLYNFPSKSELLQAMFARLIERFENDLCQCNSKAQGGSCKGNPLVAYIRAALAKDERTKRVSAALLAAVANDPAMLIPAKSHYQKRMAKLSEAGLKFEQAAIVCLALDGLLSLELFQMSPFTGKQREQVVDELLRLAEKVGGGK